MSYFALFSAQMQDFSLPQALIEGKQFLKTNKSAKRKTICADYVPTFPTLLSMLTLTHPDPLAGSCDRRAGGRESCKRGREGSLPGREASTAAAHWFKHG